MQEGAVIAESGIMIRKLRLKDICEGTGYFETLRNLAPCPPLSPSVAKKKFDANTRLGKITWASVEKKSGQIVGTVSFFFEHKYTRGGGIVAHIEDVVTREGYEGLHIASMLLQCVLARIEKARCYKAILCCSAENERFYEKFGFYKHEGMMRRDFPQSVGHVA